MSKSILGIDIRNAAISAVILKAGLKATRLEDSLHIPISNKNESEDGFARAFQILTQKINVSECICIASFPSNQISYRNAAVPFKARKKIHQILPFELEPDLPLPIDALVMDFHTIRSKDYTELIATSIQISHFKSYLQNLAEFHIEPHMVVPNGYATAMALMRLADTPQHFLFVDIDASMMTLFVIADNNVVLIRTFPVSAADASPDISIGTQIIQTLAFTDADWSNEFEPQGLYVSGDGLDAEMKAKIEALIKIPVYPTDLRSQSETQAEHLSDYIWEPMHMDNALALALLEVYGDSHINFRRGPFATAKHWDISRPNVTKFGVALGLFLIMVLFNVLADAYILKRHENQLDSQIKKIFSATFPEVKRIEDPVNQMRIKIKDAKKAAFIPEKSNKKIRTIDILNVISQKIPKETDVVITRLVIGADSITASGETDSFNSVDSIKNNLESSSYFSGVEISSANLDKSGNRVRFKLKLNI